MVVQGSTSWYRRLVSVVIETVLSGENGPKVPRVLYAMGSVLFHLSRKFHCLTVEALALEAEDVTVGSRGGGYYSPHSRLRILQSALEAGWALQQHYARVHGLKGCDALGLGAPLQQRR